MLATTGPGHARADEVDDGLGDDVRVDRELAAVRGTRACGWGRGRARSGASSRRPRGGRRNGRSAPPPLRPPDAGTRRRACRPRRNGGCGRPGCGSRRGSAASTGSPPRSPCGLRGRGLRHVDRDAEAARAVGVGRRDLDQRGVEPHTAGAEKPRDLRQRHREVVDQPRRRERPCVARVEPDGGTPSSRRRRCRGRRSGSGRGRRPRSEAPSRSRAATSARGVAHALPTKTWSPGLMAETASLAEQLRSRRSLTPGPVLSQREPGDQSACLRRGGLELESPAERLDPVERAR